VSSRGESIGDRIRDRRRVLGLSQRDLEGCGITFSYISRIELGERTPSMKALRKLAPKLGVSVHWLETGEEDPAAELARLAISHQGAPLPRRALGLAEAVLRSV
jgi:transcriptional regulator with XRE-family HTH domain